MKYVALSALFLACIHVAVSFLAAPKGCHEDCKILAQQPEILAGDLSMMNFTRKGNKDCVKLECTPDDCNVHFNSKCKIVVTRDFRPSHIDLYCNKTKMVAGMKDYKKDKMTCDEYFQYLKTHPEVKSQMEMLELADKCRHFKEGEIFNAKEPSKSCDKHVQYINDKWADEVMCIITLYYDDDKELKMKFVSELKCPPK